MNIIIVYVYLVYTCEVATHHTAVKMYFYILYLFIYIILFNVYTIFKQSANNLYECS